MEPLLQNVFGKTMAPVPAPTKMRVLLNEDDPEYSRFLGRDPEAMMSAAKHTPVKTKVTPVSHRKPMSLKQLRQWIPLMGVFIAATIVAMILVTSPRSQPEEGSPPAPYYWDGFGSPLGKIA